LQKERFSDERSRGAGATQPNPNSIPTPAELGFDPAELRKKYAEERARRLRPEGNNQYQEIIGKFAHFEDDPYVAPIKRDAISEDLDIIIIGAAFGGLLAAARLQEAGFTRFRIVEKGGDVGGTWYWNRYPGA
jgi:cyclohexanone monooxygenase